MRKLDWVNIDEVSDFVKVPAGAYVIEIEDVKDNEEYEQLEIVYQIIEGKYKDAFKDTPIDYEYTHTFNQKYSDRASGFFKRFLTELERDNSDFSIEQWQKSSDELRLVGLKMGILLREYRYINNKGEAKSRLEAAQPLTITKVREGDYETPDPRYSTNTDEAEWEWKREGHDSASTSSVSTFDPSNEPVPWQ